MTFRRAAIVLAVFAGAGASLLGQAVEPPTTYRVFLTDGRTLPSYGESALVGDRLVFMLPIGGDGVLTLQLMSLPASSVDVPRTTRYTESVRGAHYAATRAETDYQAMTAEVSRSIAELKGTKDPQRRLALAEAGRRRLLEWSNNSYGYRAADVRQLASLFDDVIGELRVAAGQSQLAFDLSAGVVTAPAEPILPAPGLRESIELALGAAALADVGEERTAILRAALSVVVSASGPADLRAEVNRHLDEEVAAEAGYAGLATDLIARADAGMRRGDIQAVDALRTELASRDRALGARRPAHVRALLQQLNAKLDSAFAFRLALDHYALVRPSLLRYERAVRPILAGIDGLRSVLTAIHDMNGPGLEWLMRADGRFQRLAIDLARIEAPADLRGVHATLESGLRMAMQACARRRRVLVAPDSAVGREGSAAAAGAQMLLEHARDELVKHLYPPKFQ